MRSSLLATLDDRHFAALSRRPTGWAACRWAATGLVLGLVLADVPVGAANREHQQMMADIRMLQEQNQQLQATLGTLMEAIRGVTTRLDEQVNTERKAFADQKLLIDGLANELRIVREKIDDTNVKLSSLSQEVDSLRNSIPATPVAPPPTAPDTGAAPAGTDPAAGAPAPQPAAAAAPIGMSPTRLWDLAFSDYAGGQWALAIQGFETYLRAFPKSAQSDDAQFYIGEAYHLDGKFKEAIAAYDKVITDYPGGDRVADAYYKRGLAFSRLNQNDKARESLETAIKNYPNAEASRLAKQVLDQLRRTGGR